MPYITKERRLQLKEDIYENPRSTGELNWLITTLCNQYLDRAGHSYEGINVVVGVLECAKLELYRRIAGPYEDSKCLQNGDVFTSW